MRALAIALVVTLGSACVTPQVRTARQEVAAVPSASIDRAALRAADAATYAAREAGAQQQLDYRGGQGAAYRQAWGTIAVSLLLAIAVVIVIVILI